MVPVILVALLVMLPPSDSTRVLPTIQGNLDGVEVTLPRDFAGDLNVSRSSPSSVSSRPTWIAGCRRSPGSVSDTPHFV